MTGNWRSAPFFKTRQNQSRCPNWLREFRKYHRDDKGSGKIVKRNDHLMDATRYLVVSGRLLMSTQPRAEYPIEPQLRGPHAWMA